MNRRDLIKTAVSGFCTFLIPAPRPRINLLDFCDTKGECDRWDMRQPFHVDEWTYATDAKAVVRVRPSWLDRDDREGRTPPAALLPWDHDRLRGWRPLKAATPLACDDSFCTDCDGTGFADGVPGEECESCGGLAWGHCPECHGRGVSPRPGVADCPACKGKAIGRFPSVVEVDGRYFGVGPYRKVLALGGEAVVEDFPGGRHRTGQEYAGGSRMKFRFDGGDGMLMGMDPAGVERRLVGGTA